MQGGLRAQLSGLESEIREGEKAVFRTSLHPWVLPINLPRDLWSQFHTSTKYSRLKLALEWSLRDQGHYGPLLDPEVHLHIAPEVELPHLLQLVEAMM